VAAVLPDPLDGRVPHPTTLMKLTTRCGTAAVDGCNEALLAKAAEAKLLRTARLDDVWSHAAALAFRIATDTDVFGDRPFVNTISRISHSAAVLRPDRVNPVADEWLSLERSARARSPPMPDRPSPLTP
jgi:hypothetical protein